MYMKSPKVVTRNSDNSEEQLQETLELVTLKPLNL